MWGVIVDGDDFWEPLGPFGGVVDENVLVHELSDSPYTAIDYAEPVGLLRDVVVFCDAREHIDVEHIIVSFEPFFVEFIVACDADQITVLLLYEIFVSIQNIFTLLGPDGIGKGFSAWNLYQEQESGYATVAIVILGQENKIQLVRAWRTSDL